MTNEKIDVLEIKICNFFKSDMLLKNCKNEQIFRRINRLFNDNDRFYPLTPSYFWKRRYNVETVRDFIKFLEQGKITQISNVGKIIEQEVIEILRKNGIEVNKESPEFKNKARFS